MVDHAGSQFSDSAVFWHGEKDTNVLRKYWEVQENYTVFPICELKEHIPRRWEERYKSVQAAAKWNQL